MNSTTLFSDPSNIRAGTQPLRDTSSFDEWAILGGMRFLLAMVVLLCHCNGFLPIPRSGWTQVGAVFNGEGAVYGFLFISGYSMAHSLRKPNGFYSRRVRRIMPLYLAGLFLGLAVITGAGGLVTIAGGQVITTPHFWEFVGNALLLQGWICSPAICNGPLWTVGVEVFYYAIAPLFISARPWVFALMICVSAIAGIYLNGDIWNMRWGCAALALAWPWFGGFHWYRHRAATTMVALIVMSCFYGRFGHSDLAYVTVVSSAAVMIAAPHIPVFRFLRARSCIWGSCPIRFMYCTGRQ